MRAYHRVDPLMDERKSHYTPAQFGAFMKVQLLAGRQARRGWFRSEKALTGALPALYAKFVGFLIEQGDLIVHDDQTLYFDGWDEWQEGDLTVKERMARLRNRKRNPTVTGTVTPTVTEPSPTAIRSDVSSSVGIDALSGAPPRAPNGNITEELAGVYDRALGNDPIPVDVRRLQKLLADLTGQPFVNVSSGLGLKAVEEQLPHGFDRVASVLRQVNSRVIASSGPGVRPTLRQLVLGADDLLNAVPRADAKEQRADSEQAAYDRRVAQTQARIRELVD